jgi:hypothetical protein
LFNSRDKAGDVHGTWTGDAHFHAKFLAREAKRWVIVKGK